MASSSKWKRLNAWANKFEWLLLLIVFALVLRLPSLWEPAWYGDENIYLAIGQQIQHGAVLYRDVTDYPNKPPVLYLMASQIHTIAQWRFFLILWYLPGIVAFWGLARLLTKNTSLTFFATLTFVFLTSSPLLEGTIGNAEIFFLTPVLFASLLAAKQLHQQNFKRHWWFLAGLMLGIAGLFKFQVGFEAIAICTWLFWASRYSKQIRIQALIWLFIGSLIPIIVGVGSLLLQGLTVSQLISALAPAQQYLDSNLTRHVTLPVRAVVTFVAIGVAIINSRRLPRSVFIAFTWLIWSLFAATLSARPYAHYLLETIPALILLAALAFTPLKKTAYGFIATGLVLFALVYMHFGFTVWPVRAYYQNQIKWFTHQQTLDEYRAGFDPHVPRNYQIVDWVNNLTSPQDAIFVWGNDAEIYFLSQRLTTLPVVTAFHVKDLSLQEPLLDMLQKTPPRVIVDTNPETKLPGLAEFLANNYQLMTTITSTSDKVSPAKIYWQLTVTPQADKL